MKYLLSLDVGITTGFAVLSLPSFDAPDLIENGAVQKHGLREELKRLLRQYLISYSVAERPVIVRGPLGDNLQECMAIVNAELPRQVEWVDPAQWKSTPFAKTPCPRNLTPHERDAIRLGRWYAYRLK